MEGDTLAQFCHEASHRGKGGTLSFTLSKRSRRMPVKSVTGLDFADDIVLPSDEIEQTKMLLIEWRANARKSDWTSMTKISNICS